MRTIREIGEFFGTDKVTLHRYENAYSKLFEEFRDREFNLLEIGVAQGKSLKMWEEYFPKARIFGLDIEPQCRVHEGTRRRVFIGSSRDQPFLENVARQIGEPLDVVIDDGSHLMQDQQIAFQSLFPKIRPGGWYVIEDLESSYHPGFGGGAPGTPGTMMQYLKSLLDYQQHAYHGNSARLFAQNSETTAWSPLAPIECRSLRGSELTADPNGWINAKGFNPPYDIYLVRFRIPPAMTGIRLNISPGIDPSSIGPGRASNGNFALTEAILHQHGQDWSTPLALRCADATFEQSGYPAKAVLSPDRNTAWAVYPNLKHDQTLTLSLARRTRLEDNCELTLVLRHASVPFHNIARFSVSVTSSDLLFRADGEPLISSICLFPNIAFIQRG